MSIERTIATKSDIEITIIGLLNTSFGIEPVFGKKLYDKVIDSHLEQIIDAAYFLIESPYIDKVYRDSYYNYYSSKLGNYKKDCIRISIFNDAIRDDSFRDFNNIETLNSIYLGFIVLRPTTPNIIGRSVISPKAVKHNGFLSLTVPISVTANFVKLEFAGFPHSSQDTETITCAETSIWALMEYFGNKYPEYKPVLPSKIVEVLQKLSAERQVPSTGLNIQQMAYALKEFGFGTKIYGKKEFGEDFKKLFSTYIESGIPVIVAVENRHFGGTIGHAFLTVGHQTTGNNEIDTVNISTETDKFIKDEITKNGISFYDHSDINRKFVFVDDNMPVYCMNKFDTPTSHYPNSIWHNCEITYFIVPLHTKIYLEAFKAKNFAKQLLFRVFVIPNGTEIYLRYFLASSRTYKNYIALESNMQEDVREMILETEMPKFVWVVEISNKILIKQKQANGFLLIDATEANIITLKPLIKAAFNGEVLINNANERDILRLPIHLHAFSIFTKNLNGF